MEDLQIQESNPSKKRICLIDYDEWKVYIFLILK